MNYSTIDYLPDLPQYEINSARSLNFSPYKPVIESSLIGWDNEAYYGTSEDYAILNDVFVFQGKEGATYDIFSNSYFDPFILILYDSAGNTIAHDEDGGGSYGTDVIFDFVAPYTGPYFVEASWNQGAYYKYASALIYEDIDTIPKKPITTTTTITKPETISAADRVYNWAEKTHPGLFPEHKTSQDAFGYYARLYSNGDALGERNGAIYYYDGGTDGTGLITYIGTTSILLSQAENAGF